MKKNPGCQIRANKKWKTMRDEEQRETVRKLFDLKCYICGAVNPEIKLGVHLHQKDGKVHNYDKVYKLKYILEHPDEFVPLCRSHHKRVHVLMDWGYNWQQIDERKIPEVLTYLAKPPVKHRLKVQVSSFNP